MLRLLVAVSACVCVGVAAAQTSPPNIVLIVTDDQGWTSTSVEMEPGNFLSRSDFYQTPRLEELAEAGMRFSNAYAASPVCSPTRASIQTGKSPAQLQMTDIVSGGDLENPYTRFLDHYVGEPLSPPLPRVSLELDEVTVAERIKQANPQYATALFGKWHLDLEGSSSEGALLHGYDEAGWGPEVPGENPKNIDRLTNRVDMFLEEKAAAGQPFFLVISHAAVHEPIQARAASIEMFENLPAGGRHDASDAHFAAMVWDLDAGIGSTLDKLAELGLEDNTYVFFVSDNGGRTAPGYGNNLPLVGSKGTVFEGGLRVPMIVKGPGIEAGSHCAIPVITHDLLPTITALAGATSPLPDGVEGADLCPVLFNGGALPPEMEALERPFAPQGELFFHFPHYLNGGSASPIGQTPSSVVRDGDFKLIKIYGASGEPDQFLLFNLAESVTESYDPESSLNLAGDMPEKVAELDTKLSAWLEAVDASLAYDVAEEVELTWSGSGAEAASDGWRSVEDVAYLFRERWEIDGTWAPTLVALETPLGDIDHAYRFNGEVGMTRKFFHVSEILTPDLFDNDHSASFEFWLKTDAVDHEQMLFESGKGVGGLSITFGDGDGDGTHDEVRMRIHGTAINYLTLTCTLDSSITESFVHLVGVYSDDPTGRFAELYLNGQLIGHLEGVQGPDEIDWDTINPASLGLGQGYDVGGNAGFGEWPFTGGGFTGEIAMFRFHNRALSGADVLDRYHELMPPCPGDCADGDGTVGISDFLAVLGQWGSAGACDLDGGGVGITDFLAILGAWGPCP